MPLVKIGGDLPGEVDDGVGLAQCGLKIAQEAVKDGMRYLSSAGEL